MMAPQFKSYGVTSAADYTAQMAKANANSKYAQQQKKSSMPVVQHFMTPVSHAVRTNIVMNEGGKGFGGGEATRDPEPTEIDPNDPKGKQ